MVGKIQKKVLVMPHEADLEFKSQWIKSRVKSCFCAHITYATSPFICRLVMLAGWMKWENLISIFEYRACLGVDICELGGAADSPSECNKKSNYFLLLTSYLLIRLSISAWVREELKNSCSTKLSRCIDHSYIKPMYMHEYLISPELLNLSKYLN